MNKIIHDLKDYPNKQCLICETDLVIDPHNALGRNCPNDHYSVRITPTKQWVNRAKITLDNYVLNYDRYTDFSFNLFKNDSQHTFLNQLSLTAIDYNDLVATDQQLRGLSTFYQYNIAEISAPYQFPKHQCVVCKAPTKLMGYGMSMIGCSQSIFDTNNPHYSHYNVHDYYKAVFLKDYILYYDLGNYNKSWRIKCYYYRTKNQAWYGAGNEYIFDLPETTLDYSDIDKLNEKIHTWVNFA